MVVVREGNTLSLYVDGTLIDVATLTDTFSFGTKALALGGYYGEPWGYQNENVFYDDVEIYGEAVTSDYISKNFK